MANLFCYVLQFACLFSSLINIEIQQIVILKLVQLIKGLKFD